MLLAGMNARQCDPHQMVLAQKTFTLLRACSHEPGSVNYLGGSDCPGARVTSRSHDDLLLCCPGASSSSSDHYDFSEFLYFLHKLLQRMDFVHVYVFLVHSGTFY